MAHRGEEIRLRLIGLVRRQLGLDRFLRAFGQLLVHHLQLDRLLLELLCLHPQLLRKLLRLLRPQTILVPRGLGFGQRRLQPQAHLLEAFRERLRPLCRLERRPRARLEGDVAALRDEERPEKGEDRLQRGNARCFGLRIEQKRDRATGMSAADHPPVRAVGAGQFALAEPLLEAASDQRPPLVRPGKHLRETRSGEHDIELRVRREEEELCPAQEPCELFHRLAPALQARKPAEEAVELPRIDVADYFGIVHTTAVQLWKPLNWPSDWAICP